MFTERKAANALGGKTARACDGCSRKRARWFCVADDAFLCQACDALVHSANQLASRHQRVRLRTASLYKTNGLINTDQDHSAPAWHQGFTRKARTPRHNNKSLLLQQQLKDEQTRILNPLPLVPEIGNEEEGNNLVSDETEDDQLLYRVPVFDPFAAELCDILTSEEGNMVVNDVHGQEGTRDMANLPGFPPADIDLAEFAADVENLLDTEVDDCSLDGKDLGVLDSGKGEDDGKFCSGEGKVKVKDEQEVEAIKGWHFDHAFDMSRDQPLLDWSFDCKSPADVDEEVEEKVVPVPDIGMVNNEEHKMEMKRNISLRLNYDSVISAWASQGCPWTTGTRPELNPDCWPDCMGTCPKDLNHQAFGMLEGLCNTRGGSDGGREARVLRYKEKRRTRLFSKKIRYEVRKLNAEKRPRMKGRFVKRTSSMGTAFPYLNK